jgi:predicted nucleic acid-binding protein
VWNATDILMAIPPYIILDTGPLSNCVVRIGQGNGASLSLSEQCRQWLTECESEGASILVPAITYYEVLREIERRGATAQRQRLRDYSFQAGRFIPLTTSHLEIAASLWAQARNSGNPTANDTSLDGDILLCAQVQSLQLPLTDYVVATTNTKHLQRFVNAAEWQSIVP